MHSYRLSVTAEKDLQDILEYTLEQFGESQMLQYNAKLISCLEAITENSSFSHYKRFKRNGKFIRSLHCQKHYIFALEQEDAPLIIIALLHDKMDLITRLKSRLAR